MVYLFAKMDFRDLSTKQPKEEIGSKKYPTYDEEINRIHDSKYSRRLDYDRWIDDVCVFDQNYIQINRKDHVLFGYELYKRLKTLIISSDRPPNYIFYSLWKLESFLVNKTKLTEEYKSNKLNFLVQSDHMEVFVKHISKLEEFDIEKYTDNFPSFKNTKQLVEF